MASFHNWTGDEEIATQVPQLLNADNAATREILDDKFNKTSEIVGASDLNSFRDEGFYCCNSNAHAETILNCPTNYAFGLMVWGKDAIVYQEVREFNRGSNQGYNNCWRRSYYSEGGQGVWSSWQQMSYAATTLAGYGITDGMDKNTSNTVNVDEIIKRGVNTSYLRLSGGDGIGGCAYLQLCGNAYSRAAGEFRLMAADSEHSAYLLGNPSGLLKWKDKNIVRSINNITADDNGNVNITVSGGGSGSGVSTATQNTWTAQQSFDLALLSVEKYKTTYANGNTVRPSSVTAVYNATGSFTLDLNNFTYLLNMGQSLIFTAYIKANANYPLIIANGGTLKYIGSPSDLAITSAGLLLNIFITLDSSSNKTSIIQASKLS